MRQRIYEVDMDGMLHEGDESEDVMDLDETHVLNFTDVNHEYLEDRTHEGRGFYEELERLLPEEDEELTDVEIETIAEEMLAEIDADEG